MTQARALSRDDARATLVAAIILLISINSELELLWRDPVPVPSDCVAAPHDAFGWPPRCEYGAVVGYYVQAVEVLGNSSSASILPRATSLLPSYNSNARPGQSAPFGASFARKRTFAIHRNRSLSASSFCTTSDHAMRGGHDSSVSVNLTTVAYGGEPTPAGGWLRPPCSFGIHSTTASIVTTSTSVTAEA